MSPDTPAIEFRAVAAHSRATNPYLHLVISWRDGEHPMNTQAFEAGRAALAALGLDAHQYVMAVHREETGNDHLHVAVNRVHPETYRAAHLSKSYYALDRAMREIELRQGWERDNGPYKVRYREDGTPEIARAELENDGRDRVDASANVKTRARDGRAWTGDRPFTEWVREAAPALKEALGRDGADWNDVRAALTAFTLKLREKGSGFVVVDRSDERLVAKASHIGRFASRGRLDQQLGPFSRDEAGSRRVDDTRRLEYNRPVGHRPRSGRDRESQRAREPHSKRATGSNSGSARSHREYQRDPEKRAQRREERAEARAGIYAEFLKARAGREEYSQAWSTQRASERERSAAITAQKHRERDELSKTLPRNVAVSLAVLAAAQRRERLRGEIAIERRNLNERLRERRSVSWREFIRGRASAGDEAAQSALRGLRYQDRRDRGRSEREDESIAGPNLSGRPTQSKLQNLAIRVRLDGAVAYHGVNDFLRREVIRDEGSRIVVREQSDQTIRAAMRMAVESWGGEITINGSATFKERAMHIALEFGVKVRNREFEDLPFERCNGTRRVKER